jgi:hypothetical protein
MFPAVELVKLVDKHLLLYRREKKEITQVGKTISMEKRIREGSWPKKGMQELIELVFNIIFLSIIYLL